MIKTAFKLYTPKYLQLLLQLITPPKEEAKPLHNALKRAPKRMQKYFFVFSCVSNDFNSYSSQAHSKTCRAETDGAIQKYSDTNIRKITADTCCLYFVS